MSVLSLLIYCKLEGTVFAKILTLISNHCISPNLCVRSLYRFKKIFASVKTPLIRHYYCSTCLTEKDSDQKECEFCKTKTKISYFIEVPIVTQLSKLYMRLGFKEMLNYKTTHQKICNDNLEDIYDGSIYKELCSKGFLWDPNNISLTWNTDGVPLYKSSKLSIWPFYFVINELPYAQRFKKDNMLLLLLDFGLVQLNLLLIYLWAFFVIH